GNSTTGHTDFFRRYFKNDSITMTFSGEDCLIILITDHIPLWKVPKHITEELIHNKIQIVLQEWEKYFYPVEKVFFSGINPHAGESGLLGKEDIVITNAIKKLKKNYSLDFSGPFSADSLFLKKNANSMMVYMYHDQALSWFKERYGFLGLNITLGLPFLRFSMDHGTAFDLYGNNQAYYLGCFYLLKETLRVQREINGN
ncbi:MAG: 4-hydroxythreonine-4-phosphate dehydrogenase PdxA, partial [Halobacteriovoraceae bacterium]|nr:4-hydroxythreonine-4-phosphate dehydrogenase PdxA [Halobacteriovoraceae bacterium]